MPSPTAVRRLLVLDDDQLMRDLLQAVLPGESYHLVAVASGEEALHTLGQGAAFDAVLTDLHLPGLEGAELAASLRQAMAPGLPLLGMSAREPSHAVRDLLDGFLLKPFGAGELAGALETAQKQVEIQSQKAASAQNPQAPDGVAADGAEPPATKVGVTSSPLNETVFESLVKIIPRDQLGHLYDMTISDIGKRHERIVAAMDAGDMPTAQREAHAIKGSCGMVGASELQALAAAIEEGAAAHIAAAGQIPAACLRLQRMLSGKLHAL